MSELDQEQAGSTADEAHDDPANLDDKIELTPTPTEAETLKIMMRSFLEMFAMDKGYDNDEKLSEDVCYGQRIFDNEYDEQT